MKSIKQLNIATTSILLASLSFIQINAADLLTQSVDALIRFDDTSTAGDDWIISGNQSYWYLREESGSNVVMRFPQSSAANHSFIVDTSGDIDLADGSVFIDRSENYMGIGISAPEEDLHIVNTTTTTSGTYPFTFTKGDSSIKLDAYDDISWSMGAYYVNSIIYLNPYKYFGIKDNATSTVPFKINEGASENSLVVASTGNIGMGTVAPAEKLDVRGGIISDSNLSVNWAGNDANPNHNIVALSGDNQGSGGSDVGFSLENKANTDKWTFRTYAPSRGFSISKIGTHGSEFKIDNPGTDMSTVVVKFAGVTVFKNGHLVNTSGNELTSLVQEQSIKLAAMETEAKAKDAELIAMKAEIAQLKTMQKKVAMMESILTNLALDNSHTDKTKVSLNLK